MQITLNQSELKEAVRSYVNGMGIAALVDDISFSATRGPEGIVTTIDVGTENAAQPQASEKVVQLAPATEVVADAAGDAAEPEAAEEAAPDAEVAEEKSAVTTGKSLFS